jgi:hypothetical protein
MLKNLTMIALMLCSSLIFASWAKPEKQPEVFHPIQDTPYSEIRFLRDAYIFRVKNKLPIPDFYYDKLNIDNPNTPSWAKKPAQEPLVPERVSPIPEWILIGILMRETRSYYDTDGNIVFIDRAIGSSGERGPFQLTPIAFKQIKKKGETHKRVMWDMVYAQDLTERYLMWLYNGPAKKNWDIAIRMYNGGPSRYRLRATLKYLKDVKRVGNKN